MYLEVTETSGQMKVYMESYGCSVNQADGEMMLGLLKKNGFEIVNSVNESDINIINTCIVKTPTENRMRYRIKKLYLTRKPLIVTGCMPKTQKNTIEKIAPKASLIGPDSISSISDAVKKSLLTEKFVLTKDLRKPKVCLPRVRKNPVIDICEISTGCMANCAFCEVKYAKGKLFSYPVDKIVEEIKIGLKEGCKEIWITSQDCGCWGFDKGKTLPELLNKICEIKEKFFIRVGMMNPIHLKGILNELLYLYQNEKIFKFLHLPVQSGSNKILKKMNRGYTVTDFNNIVENFRNEFRSLTLSTDIIVGFPDETEKDFQMTLDLIKKVKPDIVNVSKFGARPGTKAAKMEQLPVNVINRRSRVLMNTVKKIQLDQNKKWVGWKGKILIDEIKNKNVIGRNFAYKPIVLKDGKLGEFKEVKIKTVSSTSLFGI